MCPQVNGREHGQRGRWVILQHGWGGARSQGVCPQSCRVFLFPPPPALAPHCICKTIPLNSFAEKDLYRGEKVLERFLTSHFLATRAYFLLVHPPCCVPNDCPTCKVSTAYVRVLPSPHVPGVLPLSQEGLKVSSFCPEPSTSQIKSNGICCAHQGSNCYFSLHLCCRYSGEAH